MPCQLRAPLGGGASKKNPCYIVLQIDMNTLIGITVPLMLRCNRSRDFIHLAILLLCAWNIFSIPLRILLTFEKLKFSQAPNLTQDDIALKSFWILITNQQQRIFCSWIAVRKEHNCKMISFCSQFAILGCKTFKS